MHIGSSLITHIGRRGPCVCRSHALHWPNWPHKPIKYVSNSTEASSQRLPIGTLRNYINCNYLVRRPLNVTHFRTAVLNSCTNNNACKITLQSVKFHCVAIYSIVIWSRYALVLFINKGLVVYTNANNVLMNNIHNLHAIGRNFICVHWGR